MSKLKERLRSGQSGQPGAKKAPEAGATPKEEPKVEAKVEGNAPPEPVEEDELGEPVEKPSAPEAKAPEAAKPAEAAKPEDGKKEKANPWKLVDEHKSARAKAEQELVEMRKLVIDPERRKAEVAEVESLKKRNKELEEAIQFADFKESSTFKETYEKPYKAQWHASMNELRGVMIQTETGDREIEPGDMVELVNMKGRDARRKAEELFGDDAADVMKERDKIRTAWDHQQKALEDAKKDGAARSENANKAGREAFEKMSGEVKSIYDRAVEAITKDAKSALYITPKEGDSKRNEILTKGLAMVDEAFSSNPMDPSHSAEKRASIIKKHAAVRFRSAGYGVVRYELAKLQAAYDTMAARLAEYEGTVPTRGGSQTPAASAAAPTSKMEAMKARLRARSVRVA